MPPNHDQALVEALRDAFATNNRVCLARPGADGAVEIYFYEHLRGVWRCEQFGYMFAPARDVPVTYRCGSIREAVLFSLEAVCRA